MTALVRYTFDGSVATITLDDGKRNVLSPDMLKQLRAAITQADQDGAAVLLTGREGVFSAGFDLATLSAGGTRAADLLCSGFELAQDLLSFPAPVVIACNGHAIAMGAFLLLSADYRLGSAGTFKLSANEVAIGMTIPRCALEICRQRLTPAHFVRATTLAEVYDPESAVLAGFLDRVVPAAGLADAARETAQQLAKLNRRAHVETKLRARAQTLEAIRNAFHADEPEFRAGSGRAQT